MAVEYSHFDKSAVCASLGYYVGIKGSEIQIANANGRLFQAGNALTYSGGSAGTLRIATGSVSASPSATIDTGLTTVTYAVCSVLGRCPATNGTVGTLDTPNTNDGALGLTDAQSVRHRIVSTNDLWIKMYAPAGAGNATLDPISKRHTASYIAIGT